VTLRLAERIVAPGGEAMVRLLPAAARFRPDDRGDPERGPAGRPVESQEALW